MFIMRTTLLNQNSLLLTCLLFLSAFLQSQVTQQWVIRQNGDPNSPDWANDLKVDSKGNVYVTGFSQGQGTNTDFATIKYDEGSNTQWVKRYNGPANGEDNAIALAVDNKGNVYVTGYSTGNGSDRDITTIKYDAGSNTKWIKRFNGAGNASDQASAITVDDDGNVYVTGYTSNVGSSLDYITIKYDKDGDTKWVRTYNGPGNGIDQATAIAMDDDGNVYITGNSNGIGTGSDYATIKYNNAGTLQWVSRYNNAVNGFDRANALAVDHNGNVYITGFIVTLINGEGTDLTDIATIKYNTSGMQQWVSIYNRKGRDEGNDLAVDAAGNVYITGLSGTAEEDPDNDYVTVKYNNNGAQLWASIYESPGSEQGGGANAIALDAAGNVYVTGGHSIETELDYATVKYNNNGAQQWAATYDGPANGNDIAKAIALDNNGNIYITGSSANNQFDYATIKYTTAGMQKWAKRYNGPGESKGGPDIATAIAVDGDGNAHVTGGIVRDITGSDYTTYKYNTTGSREWKKTYNGLGNGPDQANAITTDADGNVYITGTSDGNGTRDDYATVKYDINGNTQWVRRYNGPGNLYDQANAIAVDNTGNVYVTGRSAGSDFFGDYATIKYDAAGNLQWVKRYNGPGNAFDQATAIAVDNAGNVYVTGESRDSENFQDYATIKYDANGNELWVMRFSRGFHTSEEATALAVDAAGNVYVTGRSTGSEFSPFDYATVKYNTAGVQQWAAIYNGPDNRTDEANDIAVDASGNVYVTGGSFGNFATIKYNAAGLQQWAALNPGNANALALDAAGNVYVTGISLNDYATIKYNTAGVQQWMILYNGPGNSSDVAYDIALDDEGNVYVTGQSTGIGTSFDYATIKYTQTALITATRQELLPNIPIAAQDAGSVKLNASAYPNAFTSYINLQWRGSDKPVNITITDAMGRLVEKRTGLGASGTIKTGFQFRTGIYYALIVQGADKLILKLIKN
jgi:uncharacterized delta-60 repeat protein